MDVADALIDASKRLSNGDLSSNASTAGNTSRSGSDAQHWGSTSSCEEVNDWCMKMKNGVNQRLFYIQQWIKQILFYRN